jgi:NAD(P)H-flavin reductase
METMADLLGAHPFFAGLGGDAIELIAGCAVNVHFAEEERIFREGDPAGTFYAIRHGWAALEIHSPGPGRLLIDTVGEGEVLGVRGPFGTGWQPGDAAGGDLVLVAGGIGLAPLRPALLGALSHRDRYRRVVLLYGARTPADLLYADEIGRWRDRDGVEAWVTVDSGTPPWRGHCQLREYFICLDGPVFRYDQLVPVMSTPEI